MALAAGLIPVPSAFSSLEDRFVFAQASRQIFRHDRHDRREITPTFSEPARKALQEVHTYLKGLVSLLETVSPDATLLFNLSLLVYLLEMDSNEVLEMLGFVWKSMPDVQGLLKALPPLGSGC
jgi:hypothetical protein